MSATIDKIYGAWETEGNTDLGHRKHLGASILGAPCERALWYTFRWATDIEHQGRLLRLFDRGQLEEKRFNDELRKVGIVVNDVAQDGQQWRFTDINGHVGGSMDAWCKGFPEDPGTCCVVEYKTHGLKSFEHLKANGVKDSKPQHYAQMQLYMYWSGMRKAFYLAVNKNDDELYSEFIDYDESLAHELIEKAGRIIASDRAPARMTEDSSYYLCKWCDHQYTCHQEATGAINCRTCVHSTPVEKAEWTCNWHNKIIDDAAQRTACEQHVFIPDFVPFGVVTDANPSENWIAYKTEDGNEFKNGSDHWPSAELQHLPAKLTDDDKLKKLRAEFSGKVVAA